MCGLAGCWGRVGGESMEEVGLRMADAVAHRGPDAAGVWVDGDAGLALSHRRLSILDLSAEGSQPMLSAGGRYVIVFNGEVYNFGAIRRELEERSTTPVAFRGHSDTEVILAAVEAWGLVPAVRRFVGMFAFALWDRKERTLHLVRDRLGIKPLFYGWSRGVLLFGSELKALRRHPAFVGDVDRRGVSLLMRHGYIPAPYSIYQGVSKLPPGCVLSVRDGSRESAAPEPYWSARAVAEEGVRSRHRGTDAEMIEECHDLLTDAVRLRMIADVPLGAFLSGGVDSSTVVALMQASSSRPVKTFSIGFHDRGYDEAEFAHDVARHLGTDHSELYVSPQEALGVIPGLPAMFDEPFADSSQIPTYLVSRLARREVVVSLSGDGGDELFAGYNRHVWGKRLWRSASRVPAGVRRAGARALTSVSPQAWDRVYAGVAPVLPSGLHQRNPGFKLHKLAQVLPAGSPEAMYHTLTSQWKSPEQLVIGGAEPPTTITDASQHARLADFTERMMFLDLVTYLPGDILTKVDRASMAVGLEARVPLLDHRVVEHAWRLPLSVKLRDGQSKWILRQVLYRYVPRELIERPKAGFGIPLAAWLRGPLRAWGEELLDAQRMREEGFLNAALVRARWDEHQQGRRDWEHELWAVLMFQAWLRAEV